MTLFAAEDVVVADNLSVGDWVTAAAIFAGGILLGRVARELIVRTLRRGDSEGGGPVVAGRIASYVFVVAGLVYALATLDVRLGPLLGALGIGGIAVALASQSVLANFLASVLLQTRRPFRRGDQILTNEVEGTVEDVNFRTVVLRTFDGERVYVPAASVIENTITNHTARGVRRSTVDVGVHYRTDLEVARDVLLEAVAGVDGVRASPPPEVWVTAFGDSSIDFAVRFWHAPDVATLWRVRSGVAMAVKRALDGAGIEIPFPQRVLTFVPPESDGRPQPEP